jgi:hypothetical protein
MRAQGSRASPENPRIQTVIRADPRKADEPPDLRDRNFPTPKEISLLHAFNPIE